MKDKVWEIDFDGHKIKAINKCSFFPPRTSEVLEIDGVVIEHTKGNLFKFYTTIVAKHYFSGVEREVEVRIAQKRGSLRTGCQVLIDGDLVGGDKAIQYPDPEEAKEQLEKGYLQYFLSVGLLCYGLPFAITMSFLDRSYPIATIALKFAFHALFFGGIMSYFYWRSMKSSAAIKRSNKISKPSP